MHLFSDCLVSKHRLVEVLHSGQRKNNCQQFEFKKVIFETCKLEISGLFGS